MTGITFDLLNAVANASIIAVPILIGIIYCRNREIKELKRKREEELARIERQLELEVYALEYFHAQIDDMVKNGSNGKLLEYLIKTGQL